MAEQDTLPRKEEKFLFDKHNFDDGSLSGSSRPKQTIFSLKEVEDLQKKAHARGMQEGQAQAGASREQQIASILKTMGANLSSLLTAEGARTAMYETETLSLVKAIFTKLFPEMNERHGLQEIERAVAAVLESQRIQPEIIVEVHPDYEDAIREYVAKAAAGRHGGAACTVTGNADLGPGDCRMGWQDGGALRDATALAEQIATHLDEALADPSALRDNGDHPPGIKGDKR